MIGWPVLGLSRVDAKSVFALLLCDHMLPKTPLTLATHESYLLHWTIRPVVSVSSMDLLWYVTEVKTTGEHRRTRKAACPNFKRPFTWQLQNWLHAESAILLGVSA